MLHGRDSNAKEFAAEFFESQASDGRTFTQILPSVKWIFPTADMLVSARFGFEMSQWFDMHTTEDPHERDDEQDLSASLTRVQGVVAREAANIGPANVVLGGISQGCAIAVHALLRGHLRLGGFIAFCSWLAQPGSILLGMNSAAIGTPVLLSHAQNDEVIRVRFGEELHQALLTLGMSVRWIRYSDGGHWLNEPQGIDDIVLFLRDIGIKTT